MQRLLESVAHEQHSPFEITLAGLSEPYVTRSTVRRGWFLSFFSRLFVLLLNVGIRGARRLP